MNTSRLQPRSPITVDGKDVRLTAVLQFLTEFGSARYSSAPSITIRLDITASLGRTDVVTDELLALKLEELGDMISS